MRSSIDSSSHHRRTVGQLIALDGLEKRAKIAGPKPLIALALDDLEEERPRLGIVIQAGCLLEKDLQQVFVRALAVDQDLQSTQSLDLLVDATDADGFQSCRQHVVVAARR